MDPAQPNGAALRAQIRARVNTLIQNFENILAEAMIEENASYDATMEKGYRMEITTHGMIRASEDLLALIRQMQELWLFGKLDTIREGEHEQGEDLLALVSELVAAGSRKEAQK